MLAQTLLIIEHDNGQAHPWWKNSLIMSMGRLNRFAIGKLIKDGMLDILQRFDRTWPMPHSPLCGSR